MANGTPFKQHVTRGNTSYKVFGITLTFTHTDVQRLLGDGFVGEDADPDLAFTLHVTGDGLTGGLNLTGSNQSLFKCLDSKRASCLSVAFCIFVF